VDYNGLNTFSLGRLVFTGSFNLSTRYIAPRVVPYLVDLMEFGAKALGIANTATTISTTPNDSSQTQRDARNQSLPGSIINPSDISKLTKDVLAICTPPPPPPDCNQPKPQGERPSHMKTNSDFANLVKWGTGPGEALTRLGTVTAAEIAAMKNAGITPGMIRSWWQVYSYMRDCVKLGKDQETPIYRAKLMEEILKKW
jgi:hypothetical protein